MDEDKDKKRKRIEFVVKQLAIKTPFSKIKQDYQILFEHKISGEQIIEISDRFGKSIEKMAVRELGNVRDCPAAHTRVRLDFIYQGMLDAATPRPLRSVRVDENEYEVVMGMDHSALAKYLQLAREEEYSAKKLMLEKIKMELDIQKNETGYTPVEVDTGIDDDEPLAGVIGG